MTPEQEDLPLPFCVLEQGTLLPESTGNTQEVVIPSRHDRTTVDWHVKPEKNNPITNKQRGHEYDISKEQLFKATIK